MFIIKSVSRSTGYTCQGTHAFPTKETVQHYLDINRKNPGVNYYIIEAPVGTPLLAINKVQSNNYRFGK